LRTAWWTIDSGDTWERLPAVDEVIARVREQGGGVVLLHDFDRSGDRCRYVLDLTSRLVELAQRSISSETVGRDPRLGRQRRCELDVACWPSPAWWTHWVRF
jgi:hypothetical protein